MNKLWNYIIVHAFFKEIQIIEKFSTFTSEFRETAKLEDIIKKNGTEQIKKKAGQRKQQIRTNTKKET